MKKEDAVKSMIAAALAVFALGAYAAPLTLVSPKDGETVPTLSDGQKAYFKMPRKERIEYFASKECRKKMAALGYRPKRVTLAWNGGAPGASYNVELKRAADGRTVFSTMTKETSVKVENLEIATEYKWSVTGGGELSAGFTTEDATPRLIHISGVPNVRDLGGYIGLGGRRVRQGMIYRSAGLNDNATSVYKNRQEMDRAGMITPKMREKEAKIKAHIERYRGYQAKPASFPRSHKGWKAWSKRHPDATVADYFKRRIDGDEAELKRLFRDDKNKKPGKNRLSETMRIYLAETLGIKTEIDLRSNGECYGMTGSPIGHGVKWVHIPSRAYGSMQRDGGKAAFKKVFEIFLDEKNYPIDFHCISGQDRTGSVAFILNGLLGVAEDELYMDWEATGFWNKKTEFRHSERFDRLVNGFKDNVPGATIHEKIENYVLSLGFTKDDIEKFRSIMLK